MELKTLKLHKIIWVTFLLSLLVIAGCSTKETSDDNEMAIEKEQKENREKEEVEQTENTDNQEKSEKIKKSNIDSEEIALGDYDVFLGGEIEETEQFIIVKGESNLLPGARIVGEVSVADDKYFTDTSELVQDDGTFYMELPHHTLNEETTVTIKFHFDGQQDDAIKRHYGDRGQKLKGDFIYQHKGKVGGGNPQNIFKMAKVETTFDQSEEMAIRHFSAPTWYPIPEDQGEPRVWIKVDEIKNDENFYYLHGRSNLLEGSEIQGKYNFETTYASVKPDGSFDMKFEYVYKDDAKFVLKFDPSKYSQWNIIQETYGAKGQKLVGDLVVQDKYSDKLYVKIEEMLESTEIKVPENVQLKIDGTEVTMLLPDHLLFDFDQYVLKDESKKVLSEISQTLALYNQQIEIEISGHTDNQGSEKYNLELSKKRAEEVKNYIASQSDFPNVTFITKGFGMTKPIASNDTELGQAKNRRVEIVIDLKK